MFARLGSLPLFWQVFGTNALALVLARLRWQSAAQGAA